MLRIKLWVPLVALCCFGGIWAETRALPQEGYYQISHLNKVDTNYEIIFSQLGNAKILKILTSELPDFLSKGDKVYLDHIYTQESEDSPIQLQVKKDHKEVVLKSIEMKLLKLHDPRTDYIVF